MNEPAADVEIDDIDQQIMEAMQMVEDGGEVVTNEEAPVAEAPVEAPVEAPADEAPVEAPADEAPAELLEPQQHWPDDIKNVFSGMSREQQDAWMYREQQVQRGFEERAERINAGSQATKALEQLQGFVQPNMAHWQREGLNAGQGVMRAMRLEQDLRDNPKDTLLRMARERGVDLEQAFQDQPYVPPEIRALQETVTSLTNDLAQERQTREESAQLAQRDSDQQIVESIHTFASTPDGAGGLKYPHAREDFVLNRMAQAIEGGQANDLPSAYEVALGSLQKSSLFAGMASQVTANAQAEVNDALQAAQVVTGEPAATAKPEAYNEDAAILKQLEDAGLQ